MAQLRENRRVACPECGQVYDVEAERCPIDGTSLVPYSGTGSEGADPLIGEHLDDRYQIESVLGEGGMGKVYAGRQLSVDREVAIKLVRTEHLDDETTLKRFFREARVISKFSHPNIVNLFDFGQTDASVYFVMELIDGVSLEDIIGNRRVGVDLTVEIAKQTCGALSEPHSHGIVHRDIKPENLMLVPISDGRIQTKIVDFGLADILHGPVNLTATDVVCGTPYYMAPEQAQGEELGPYTDIYALGIILYQMLAGRRPFSGDKVTEVVLKQVQVKPARLGEEVTVRPNVPDELIELVHEMLVKAPDDRLDDVLAIRSRLEEIEAAADFGPVRVDPGANGEAMFADLLGTSPVSSPVARTNRMESPAAGGAVHETGEPRNHLVGGPGGSDDAPKTDRDADGAKSTGDRAAVSQNFSKNLGWVLAGGALVGAVAFGTVWASQTEPAAESTVPSADPGSAAEAQPAAEPTRADETTPELEGSEEVGTSEAPTTKGSSDDHASADGSEESSGQKPAEQNRETVEPSLSDSESVESAQPSDETSAASDPSTPEHSSDDDSDRQPDGTTETRSRKETDDRDDPDDEAGGDEQQLNVFTVD